MPCVRPLPKEDNSPKACNDAHAGPKSPPQKSGMYLPAPRDAPARSHVHTGLLSRFRLRAAPFYGEATAYLAVPTRPAGNPAIHDTTVFTVFTKRAAEGRCGRHASPVWPIVTMINLRAFCAPQTRNQFMTSSRGYAAAYDGPAGRARDQESVSHGRRAHPRLGHLDVADFHFRDVGAERSGPRPLSGRPSFRLQVGGLPAGPGPNESSAADSPRTPRPASQPCHGSAWSPLRSA